ncbi:hypothetical protein GMLC_16770 [Geomonas limicola]|uniref:Fibronectin type-III domain-containing protein n=1 Tax=Geomonas limicola TaxID=2740186 RepID=A0A6V8N6A7_9BACT|nr:hypothetical protein [Geomonas limicola]GFO68098.1 hypothetical protein GMLC_16770 [Geomonas limicola]
MPIPEQYDIFDPNLRRLTYPELHMVLTTASDALEVHSFFRDNWESYVPNYLILRNHLVKLKEFGVGADRGDRDMKAQRDQVRARAELDILLIINYVVMRAIEKQDPSLLQNTGLPLKELKTARSSYRIAPTSVPVVLTAKHKKTRLGVESGTAILAGKHVKMGGPYHLQICKGHPASEESWCTPGGHYRECGNIILNNLESANEYFFRIRSDGPDGPGPWSQVVSLVIV